jgi:hypothetical protein
MEAGVTRECSGNRCPARVDSLDPPSDAEAEKVERLEEDLVTPPIRGFCALYRASGMLEPLRPCAVRKRTDS